MYCAKLTAEQVKSIRKRFAAGEYQKDLAIEFGINPSAIQKAVSGTSWAWLEKEESGRCPARPYYFALFDFWHGAKFAIPIGEEGRSPESCHRWIRIKKNEYEEMKDEYIVRTNEPGDDRGGA